MQKKIINVLPHPPAYDLYSGEPRPEISWDTPCGKWVGIWGFDWSDLLGNAVLQLSDEFQYEVWQPDPGADKVYSHTFENGLVHKLFPAEYRNRFFGFKLLKEIHSGSLIDELKNSEKRTLSIIHINGDISSCLINRDILSVSWDSPILCWFHGDIYFPILNLFRPVRNLSSKINIFFDHLWIKKNINKIKAIVYQTEKNLTFLKTLYHEKLEKITAGCDFSFFKKLNKDACRMELGLPREKFTLISVSNLIPRKQIDRFIDILDGLRGKYDFLYLVLGHGAKEYENYLKDRSKHLLAEDKIRFPGFLRGEPLLKYLNSADMLVSMANTEGGPVSVMEAFACELPVFCTRTGHTAEFLETEGAGTVVGIRDYKQWQEKLADILETKKPPKVLVRDSAKQYYDWENIGKKFILIYRELFERK